LEIAWRVICRNFRRFYRNPDLARCSLNADRVGAIQGRWALSLLRRTKRKAKSLCKKNVFVNDALVLTSTSGSTGAPFYFPRNNDLDMHSARLKTRDMSRDFFNLCLLESTAA
jgi:acyl-coenzyme A synthetase/AMP-(fatty) acid ligase